MTGPAPEGRDHGIDTLRAVAIGGVVLGHWLVTAIVLTPDGALAVDSPLRTIGGVAPVSWLLQTLGLFFFVAGYAATWHLAKQAATPADPGRPTTAASGAGVRRLQRRLVRLIAPVTGFLAAWALVLAGGALAGTPADTLRTVGKLAVSPLWFLVVLVTLTAVTGPLRRLVARRYGLVATAGGGLLVVAAADAGAGWTPSTVLAGWLVPYALGIALAAGRLRRRATGWALSLGGVFALLVLVLAVDYPTSAVGVPGVGRSNLNPPSLAAMALAFAQVGVALSVRQRLSRVRWPLIARVNAGAMRVYLWHQSVLIVVTVLLLRLPGGPVPGLHTAPDGAGWVVARLAWLPVLAAGLWLVTIRDHRSRWTRARNTLRAGQPGITRQWPRRVPRRGDRVPRSGDSR